MFVEITNTPRDYAWGSSTAIAELLGRTPSGRPEAELWLGAHAGSPARLVSDDRSLADVLPEGLPFLLKVLAASAPLSLQAHPSPEQAAAGFARENAAGLPLDAPERNYKDAFHKPELIYALSEPFRALCGFRPVAETRALIEPLGADGRIRPLLERLREDDNLEDVFGWLISRGPGVDELVVALGEVAPGRPDPSWNAVRALAAAYPGDPGIAISLLLHTAELHPGEALYLPAGNIHAYFDGLGIEVMASSDNVLRGGLTPKHIDVPELLSVLDFRPRPLPYLVPVSVQPGVDVFRPDVPDFELTVVHSAALAAGATVELSGPAIVLATGGAIELDAHQLGPGHSAYLDDLDRVTVRGSGTVFIASPNARRLPD